MVLYEKKDKIAYITFNRPERLNILDEQAVEELVEIWKDFRDDDNLWVAVLRGNGKSFCAGVDVGKLEVGQKWNLRMSFFFGEKKIGPSNYNVWKPIIAAVQGYVLGVGFYLVLEADLKIASEDAEFGLPEPRVGIPTIFTPLLSRHLLSSHALELLFLGDRIGARRAYEIGLVNRVVPRDQLEGAAEDLARKICQNGPLSLRSMKEVFYRSREMNFADSLSLIEHIFTPVMNSEDAAEGKQAFLEKRRPKWKVR
ncbi:MAG: enoyl-CoA hydratase/isomerase family protein [Armatimonadetes bacterium]|nr:enoyl-CoA hydratase/isomerase family protein [Armatimonadota bacterium]